MTLQETFDLDYNKRVSFVSNGKTLQYNNDEQVMFDGLGEVLDYVSFSDLSLDARGYLHLTGRRGANHNVTVEGYLFHYIGRFVGDNIVWSAEATAKAG